MGRQTSVDAPDTQILTSDSSLLTSHNVTMTSYYPTGQVKATWGDQTYARFYQYDALNRMSILRTFQNLAHGTEPTAATTGGADTTWNYNPQRGWLANKRYADNKGPDYTYTPAQS